MMQQWLNKLHSEIEWNEKVTAKLNVNRTITVVVLMWSVKTAAKSPLQKSDD